MGETMQKPRGGRRSGGFLEGLLRELERKKRGCCVMREEREDGGLKKSGATGMEVKGLEFAEGKGAVPWTLQRDLIETMDVLSCFED
ncbi:hypothetical protein QJS10_CPA07g01123 [Acorus calamus]|uniref:Uncharacterized protein n=1 Tax=Acorus calamus TaxID=4465 RepID=A0AAV9EFI1_ACOCL|nr:hypothetical protein QJS10_CPA07g01123 [Acorus calamus]